MNRRILGFTRSLAVSALAIGMLGGLGAISAAQASWTTTFTLTNNWTGTINYVSADSSVSGTGGPPVSSVSGLSTASKVTWTGVDGSSSSGVIAYKDASSNECNFTWSRGNDQFGNCKAPTFVTHNAVSGSTNCTDSDNFSFVGCQLDISATYSH